MQARFKVTANIPETVAISKKQLNDVTSKLTNLVASELGISRSYVGTEIEFSLDKE